MDSKFIIALVIITLALVFYTIGVFGERLSRVLKLKHVALFYLGLLCDTIGTGIMTSMALSTTGIGFNSVHSIMGLIAILLMLIHAVWATIVMVRNNEKLKRNFHKFSFIV